MTKSKEAPAGDWVMARMTSKGQITVPKEVREALGLGEGDSVLFAVYEGKAVIAKIPNFLDLAGSVAVPEHLRGASWDKVREENRRIRARQWKQKWG